MLQNKLAAFINRTIKSERFLLGISITLQGVLAFFFGHAYDMRIFMATGYLVATGQNPYIPQNLSSVFHNATFQGITSVGYPPPWPLVSGLIYLVTYRIVPNLLLYNLALKIPIIAANIALAYLVAKILMQLAVDEKVARTAWLFLLFNPFILYVTSAWGQFDSIVALLSLLALVCLNEGKMAASAFLLALAVSFKPTALPLVPAVFVYLLGKPRQLLWQYFVLFFLGAFLLFVAPFLIFGWDPSPILQHWNAHFSVGGGLSFMTFLELIQGSYQLPGLWWLVGMVWVPALIIASFSLKPGGEGLINLVKKSTALIMVFFLFRAWLSEPNLALVLPLFLILSSMGELDRRVLTVMWILPLAFSFFNTSTFQLLFPSLPALMDRLLHQSEVFHTARLVIRIIVVIPWLLTCGWVINKCIKNGPLATG
jgi:ALG6, ALG8 glycosyltransferase family